MKEGSARFPTHTLAKVHGPDWRCPRRWGSLLLVPAVQCRLWPDARPLVERLGEAFFRTLPTHPGVYLLRDEAETVLYVGKAKNLRQRLGSYRVANPDRLPRRLLRLLSQARRIEWQACPDEAAALARERELLLAIRPRFNRAGVWPAPPRFLTWRATDHGLELAITDSPAADWHAHGPLGPGAMHLRALLVRVLWCVFHPGRGLTDMPTGWFAGRLPAVALLSWNAAGQRDQVVPKLRDLMAGDSAGFAEWLLASLPADTSPFSQQALAADLETLAESFRVKT